ncbi:MAG: DEAD/DEAH box helicase family protein [Bacteroidales bacterium]|nr:DEAD/DEAH box helicase family protein [Bacteroidales bacterium]
MQNFDYLLTDESLSGALRELHRKCSQAEYNQVINPEVSVIFCRQALEWLVQAIYKLEHLDKPDTDHLYELTTTEEFRNFIADPTEYGNVHYIRKIGNQGAHGNRISKKESYYAVVNLFDLVGALMYRWGFYNDIPKFDTSLIPTEQPALTVVPNVNTALAAKPAKPDDTLTSNTDNKQPLHVGPSSSTLTEAETRKLFIDVMLREAGWDILTVDGAIAPAKAGVEIPVTGMPKYKPTDTGNGFVDYVLFGKDSIPLAVIEAKRTSKSPEEGKHQAELYADCLEKQYGYRPAIYYTNGFETKYIDGMGYPQRPVYSFHSLEDLEYLRQKRGRADITDITPREDIAGRYYQINAVKSVCEHFNKKHRKALLVMATGTGKTRMSISLVEILMRNNWIKKVLFLADRTSLVGQAYRNFVDLLPSETKEVLSETKDPNMQARLMFSTYQTMINYIDGEKKSFSVGNFDLIIIDEAHRSVFGKYGSIFDYFDSLLVGLTATPRDEIEKSTYDLLELDSGCPNSSYELDEAVADHYLVPYETLERKSDIMRRGVKYSERTEEEKKELDRIFGILQRQAAMNPDEEVPTSLKDLPSAKIFRQFYNEDTISRMLTDLMDNGLRVHSGEEVGKTIIFAPNHKTAVFVVEVFNKLYPEYGSDYCVLIDNYVNHARNLIESMEDMNKRPQIAVTVDMLDTGIDITCLLNLVFFKPVHSKIKFDQMIGRGTRLCPNLFGPGQDKDHFLIFDYCNNFEYFERNPEGAQETKVISLTERLFSLRLDLAIGLQTAQYQEDDFCKGLHDELKEILFNQVCSLDDARIAVRKIRSRLYEYTKKDRWQYISELDGAFLSSIVAPLLPRTTQGEMAMRFDVIMLQIQLGQIFEDDEHKYAMAKSQEKLVFIASQLEQKASIPQVMAKMAVIKEVQSSEFWDTVSMSSLERVRIEMRDLLQYLAGETPTEDFFVDFTDEIEMTEGTYNFKTTATSYKQKVLKYLTDNYDSPTVQKIIHLEQLTGTDISELERIFWQELGTKEDYDEYVQGHRYGNIAMFIRSIVKLDRDEAMNRYRSFISASELNSQQELYLKGILDYVCQNGDIEPAAFQTAPLNTYQWMRVFGTNMIQVKKVVDDLHNVVIPLRKYPEMDEDSGYLMAAES